MTSIIKVFMVFPKVAELDFSGPISPKFEH